MTDTENVSPEPPAAEPPRLARRFELAPPVRRHYIVYGLIAALVIAGLLLPPISLFDRLFNACGDLALSNESPTVDIPEGLAVLQAQADQAYRLTLSATARADLAATDDATLAAARDALPVNLMLESPVYRIAACGETAQPATLRVSIPAEARPINTLDLYAFDAGSGLWNWIGGGHDESGSWVQASVDAVPDIVALVQTTSVAPAIGVEAMGQALNSEVVPAVTEVYPSGLVIAADGSLGGEQAALPKPSATQAVYPVVRNYLTAEQPNPDLVRGVLQVPTARQAHIDALAALAAAHAGVVVDYQGLMSSDRDAYSAFIDDLAAAVHGSGRRLIVVLPQPSFTPDGQAETGGYDWYRIGQAADVVQAAVGNPALLEWAAALVNRYRLQPILSFAPAHLVNQNPQPISFRQAISGLGTVSSTQTLSVTAGTPITFTLQAASAIDRFAFDADAAAYTYEFFDKSGTSHTITIPTAGALAGEIAGLLPYHVRGAVVRGLDTPGIGEVLTAYRQQSAAKVPPDLDIVWLVQRADEEQASISRALAESWYVWRAPSEPGTYEVSASVAGTDLGALEIVVNPSAPEDEVKAGTAGVGTGESGAAGAAGTAGGAQADACFSAAYVADVSVPDGTHFDKGADFTKTWKVRNSGTCAWPANTEIAFVSGSQLGAASTQPVGALEPGEEVEINVPMKSGDADGNFTGVWQLRSPDGFFGQTLTVVIQTGTPPAAAAPIGNIGSFEAGAHVDSFRRADLLKSAGLKWIKIQTYAGVDVSGAIENAHANGFKILLGIIGDKERVLDSTYQAEYAQAVAAMAAAGADAIEVWNEPNIDREWPTGQVNGASYTALLAQAYSAIKAANPGTLVISGAPAPTGFWGAAGCSPNGCNDDVFLAQMAAAGAARYMDCIGAHHNSGTTSPSVSSGRPEGNHYSWYFLPTLNLYYNSFRGARKVCFTELGYLSGEGYPDLASTAPAFAWAKNTTVAQQAQWLAEAASLSASSGKVRLMIIWNADFARYDSDPMAGYAIIRPGDACPACDALRGVLGSR